MKLLRAKFTNFRLLRDVELDFRLPDNKKLVVLRAANESGKTTILTALQWGLYGDDAIPRGRRLYRLHPIDWNIDDGQVVTITVEIDFELTEFHRTRAGEINKSLTRYRLIRSTTDTIEGDLWMPGSTEKKLFEITSKGYDPIDPPDALLAEELPETLREVFFTDGDRALSFIEGDVSLSTKQAKVRNAIRNLLGLDVIEGARSRVKKAGLAVNAKVKQQTTDASVQQTVERIDSLTSRAEQLESDLNDAETQFNTFDQEWAETERKIEELLAKGGGDRAKLVSRSQQIAANVESADKQLADANREHSQVLGSLELGRDLLYPALAPGIAVLDELRGRGDIPDTTIPILEDRLKSDACICGESLQGHDEEVLHRRQHIQGLIDDAIHGDAIRKVATNLYFSLGELQPTGGSRSTWADLYGRIAARREELQSTRKRLGELQASLESELKQVQDIDLDGLRRHRNECQGQRDRFNATRSRLRVELDNVTQQLANERNRQEALLRRQGMGQRLMAEFGVAQDLEGVLDRAYQKLTNEELDKVSSRMNEIFLDMIVADPDQRALIQRADITEHFDIMVYGAENRPLNPDLDLNGASRRALTLAFILALTQISEVEGPNVIDTPLGMMSGLVKESVLTTAIRESSQLILFLTHSEIDGCHTILDREAGRVITLTNSTHYPTMLVNPPPPGKVGIVTCPCDQNSSCEICERRLSLAEPTS